MYAKDIPLDDCDQLDMDRRICGEFYALADVSTEHFTVDMIACWSSQNLLRGDRATMPLDAEHIPFLIQQCA